MALKLPNIELFACLLYKDEVAKRYLPETFPSRYLANIYAKEYLNIRQKKKLSIKVERLKAIREDSTT